MRADISVVGAGPAGLYAAQILAQRGFRVEVLEEHARVGEPVHCTGIVGGEALALPGVPVDGFLARPTEARLHSPAGHTLAQRIPAEPVYVIDRGRFDRALADAAIRAGARIRTSTKVVTVHPGRAGVALEVDGPESKGGLRAEMALLACGARYRLQRDLGWGMPARFLASAQVELTAVPASGVDVFLRHEIAPSGFGWFVPIERGTETAAKLGVMAAKQVRQVLDALVRAATASGRVGDARSPVVTRLLPLGPLRSTYGDRVLAIGDAAGLVKPMTGGGIYYSLLSARWAADTVTEAFARGDFRRAPLRAYETRWRAALGPELEAGARFRDVLGGLSPDDLDALVRLAITDGVMPVVRAAARFNWHRNAILSVLRHPGVVQVLSRRLAPGWFVPTVG